MIAYALTTVDNPFDPFDEWDDWYRFDWENGYDCCGKLARFNEAEDYMSPERQQELTKLAIERILAFDFTKQYRMFSKEIEIT